MGLGQVFLPLFDEPQGTESQAILAQALSTAAPTARCLRPPVPGLGFLSATGDVSNMLDAWWGRAAPPDWLPVVLLLHQPGLESWIEGLDARFVVGVPGPQEAALYAGFENVQVEVTQDARALTRRAIGAHPVDALSQERETAETTGPGAGHPAPWLGAPPPVTQPTGRRRFPRFGLGRRPRGTGGAVPAELTRLALSHRRGRIVGVTSRAGGVGKTAISAALGIVYGEAVRGSGGCAAVVDQNIGNPDQWDRLRLASQARTVFEIMGDIEAGREWSVPAWGRTPHLAVYPERRDLGDGYGPGQIERFSAQLRQLHMLSVVDLPNRLPDLTSAEAAVCAGWIAVTDLLLLPTTDDPNRLRGVLEYLEAPMVRGDPEADRPPLPVIVPYIRSPLRAIRENPRVLDMLERVRRRAGAVVEIPKDDRATLAMVQGTPITEIDDRLREAYIELALAVGRALATRSA